MLKRLKGKCHIDDKKDRKPQPRKETFSKNGNLKADIEIKNSLGGLNYRL